MIKSFIRRLLPANALRAYRSIRRHAQERRYGGTDASAVFTTIYSERLWGGTHDNPSSGAGTRTDAVAAPYVEMAARALGEQGPRPTVVVDLGCGDFVIGRQLLPYCERYIGVDVVESLIAAHRAAGYGSKAEFRRLDICRDALPDGDVCFVRQVLQHLSNDQIRAILPKLSKYRVVYVTEHQPTDIADVVPNLDKECGPGIRLYRNSGVFLEAPPFAIPPGQMDKVLEVPAGPPADEDPGMIRTFRIPGSAFRLAEPAP